VSLIVTVAPNGAYKQPADHPAVPITPATLATTAKSCLDAGAAMLHMHIRDAQGRHSLDVEGYREAQRVVRQAVGDAMVIQITSEATGVYQAPAQIAWSSPAAGRVRRSAEIRPRLARQVCSAFMTWRAPHHGAGHLYTFPTCAAGRRCAPVA
jgi:uncharacterized protein (DUF849 family)